MDYYTVLQFGSVMSLVLLVLALGIYVRAVAGVRHGLSSSTVRALAFFGAATVTIGVIVLVGVFWPDLTAQRLPITFYMVFLINAVIHIATDSSVIHRLGYAGTTVLIGLAVIVPIVLDPTTTYELMVLSLAVLFTLTLLLTVWILYSSPSPFAASLLGIEGSFLIVWTLILTGQLITNLQLMPYVFVPAALSAALLASVTRPWRLIASLYTVFYAVMNVAPIALALALDADYFRLAFVVIATLPVFASLFSLDFFAQQATTTKASVPSYITASLVAASLLVTLHIVEWAFSYPNLVLLDIQWLEWVLGNGTIGAFVVAAIATITKRYVSLARRVFLVFVTVVSVLAHDFASAGRWTLESLLWAPAGMLVVGIVAYAYTVRRLYRLGARTAAGYFAWFMLSIVLLVFAVMLSFVIPVPITLFLFVGVSISLLLSSPTLRHRLRSRTS